MIFNNAKCTGGEYPKGNICFSSVLWYFMDLNFLLYYCGPSSDKTHALTRIRDLSMYSFSCSEIKWLVYLLYVPQWHM